MKGTMKQGQSTDDVGGRAREASLAGVAMCHGLVAAAGLGFSGCLSGHVLRHLVQCRYSGHWGSVMACAPAGATWAGRILAVSIIGRFQQPPSLGRYALDDFYNSGNLRNGVEVISKYEICNQSRINTQTTARQQRGKQACAYIPWYLPRYPAYLPTYVPAKREAVGPSTLQTHITCRHHILKIRLEWMDRSTAQRAVAWTKQR